MFVHLSKEYSATAIARRPTLYHCRKCGTEFGCEVLRVGEGHGTSVYFLDNAGAETRASERALAKAHELADQSPEIVPCPKCDEIAHEMLDDWGRGSQSSLLMVAATALAFSLLAVVGICLIGAASRRPFSDVFEAMLVCCGVAVACGVVIFIRRWRINCSRPSSAPGTAQKLIDLGYMPALIVHPEPNGSVRLSPARPLQRTIDGTRFVVPLLKADTPPVCCYCMGERTRPVSFGACGRCAWRERIKRVVLPLFVSLCVALLAFALMQRMGVFGDRPHPVRAQLYVAAMIGLVAWTGTQWFIQSIAPAARARRLDALRNVWAFSSPNAEYLQSLRSHYEGLSYDLVLTAEEYAELRSEAVQRKHANRPSAMARLWERFKAVMTTDVG